MYLLVCTEFWNAEPNHCKDKYKRLRVTYSDESQIESAVALYGVACMRSQNDPQNQLLLTIQDSF
jgi:phosphotransferase system IIB component